MSEAETASLVGRLSSGDRAESVRPDPAPVVIGPPARVVDLGLRELWDYRELLGFLTWRDIKVRYKQSILGVSWAIIQPVATMVVFSLFFGRLGGIPSDGVAYPLFSFAALVPWTFFANSLSHSSGSLVSSSNLIRKVYFPRLVIPLSSVLSGLVDFSISFSVLGVLLLVYGAELTLRLLLLPLLILLVILTALAVGLWLAALNVRYRDVRYTVPFLIQLWLFATPVAYPSSLVPEVWRVWYGLNPMVGVIEGFRWVLLGAGSPPGPLWLVSLLATGALLAGGIVYFRKMEQSFADVV